MSIAFKRIEDAFEQAGLPGLVPSFSFAAGASPAFRLLRLQCRGELDADERRGPHVRDEAHVALCRDMLRIARETTADVVLTPEYSFPLEMIDEMTANPELQPPSGKLWCLACQGEERARFEDRLGSWGRHGRAQVVRPLPGEYEPSDFVCALLYVFMGSDDHTLCIVPQYKLYASADPELYCEGVALTRGTAVYAFGSDGPNRLCSIICADAFHPELEAGHFFREGESWIVLHPQLNKRPRHGDMVRLRDSFYSRTAGRGVVYVTSNWAESTTVRLPQQAMTVSTPWSCVYMKHTDEWVDSLRRARSDNLPKGLGFAYSDKAKVKVWYAHKREHLQLLAVAKPNPAVAEVSRIPAGVKAERLYVPDEARGRWLEAELPFDAELPDVVAKAAAGPFRFPLDASTEQRDRFFGLCLGHGEAGQLQFATGGDNPELSGRLSLHIDDDCESVRNEYANRVGKLIYCLNAGEAGLPGQLRHMQSGPRFHLSGDYPHYNVFPAEGDEREGVWVAYAGNEREARELSVKMLGIVGRDRETRVCVFSTRDGSHETVAYPAMRVDCTAPARIGSPVDFTVGGNPAWNR
ncbi:hypothetical protein [Paenibacillus flagellatus]|uniref:hypothetical protein n=1 Tax=Paenibacillus flagellatus TaxID=2211139 RepID=UPI0013051CA3|nr:hypothetical protein [Paenibacillus flagellatus]